MIYTSLTASGRAAEEEEEVNMTVSDRKQTVSRLTDSSGSVFHLSAASSPGVRGGAPTSPLPLPQPAQTAPVPSGSPQPPRPSVSHPVPLHWPRAAETPGASASHPRRAQGGVISQCVTP